MTSSRSAPFLAKTGRPVVAETRSIAPARTTQVWRQSAILPDRPEIYGIRTRPVHSPVADIRFVSAKASV